MTADPKLGDDREAARRDTAACAAALAGCGKGNDPAPDEAARAKLRGHTLDWLKIELAFRQTQAGKPETEATAPRNLQHWKIDTGLAGIRDPDALKELPAAERNAWQALWADVDRLLQRAEKRP